MCTTFHISTMAGIMQADSYTILVLQKCTTFYISTMAGIVQAYPSTILMCPARGTIHHRSALPSKSTIQLYDCKVSTTIYQYAWLKIPMYSISRFACGQGESWGTGWPLQVRSHLQCYVVNEKLNTRCFGRVSQGWGSQFATHKSS